MCASLIPVAYPDGDTLTESTGGRKGPSVTCQVRTLRQGMKLSETMMDPGLLSLWKMLALFAYCVPSCNIQIRAQK